VLRFLPFLLFCLPLQANAAHCSASTPEAFEQFFTRFAENKAFAISRTVFPLQSSAWEYGLDETNVDVSAPVKWAVSREKFSRTPSLSVHMKENGLRSNIQSLTSKEAVVEIFKPNTDWLTANIFRRHGNCWWFHEYQDHSL
jgi:hypothetical protein